MKTSRCLWEIEQNLVLGFALLNPFSNDLGLVFGRVCSTFELSELQVLQNVESPISAFQGP